MDVVVWLRSLALERYEAVFRQNDIDETVLPNLTAADRGALSSLMPERRFPPPWDIEEANASCFIVKDNNGQALAYVYFESDPGRRTAANLFTRDEARRIAVNATMLPWLSGVVFGSRAENGSEAFPNEGCY